jgi:hypothetical protein
MVCLKTTTPLKKKGERPGTHSARSFAFSGELEARAQLAVDHFLFDLLSGHIDVVLLSGLNGFVSEHELDRTGAPSIVAQGRECLPGCVSSEIFFKLQLQGDLLDDHVVLTVGYRRDPAAILVVHVCGHIHWDVVLDLAFLPSPFHPPVPFFVRGHLVVVQVAEGKPGRGLKDVKIPDGNIDVIGKPRPEQQDELLELQADDLFRAVPFGLHRFKRAVLNVFAGNCMAQCPAA